MKSVIINRLSKTLKAFQKNDDGNFSIMFALGFFATFITAGAAIDIALIYKNQSKLQNIADSGALYALQHKGTNEEKEKVFAEFVNKFSISDSSDFDVQTRNVKVIENNDLLTISADVYAPHELLLLQNISDFQKVGAKTEATIGLTNTEVALAIDISSSMRNERIAEAKQSATFFVNQLLEESSVPGKVSISFIPFGGTVRVPEEMSNLLQTPTEGFESYSRHWIDGQWNQCFELDPEDIETGVKFNRQYRAIPDFYSFRETNPWCPRSGNEFLPLTDNAEALNAKIDGLTLSDGTGSDQGMHWAYENLNDYWKNQLPGGLAGTPATNQSDTRKIIVFMTDGGITGQHFVRESDRFGDLPYDSKKRQRLRRKETLNSFYSVCDKAKSEDIEVYTIGYLLRRERSKKELINCATTPSHYLDASSGDLTKIFAGIADSLSPIRLSN